jgi:hypothetical protein
LKSDLDALRRLLHQKLAAANPGLEIRSRPPGPIPAPPPGPMLASIVVGGYELLLRDTRGANCRLWGPPPTHGKPLADFDMSDPSFLPTLATELDRHGITLPTS